MVLKNAQRLDLYDTEEWDQAAKGGKEEEEEDLEREADVGSEGADVVVGDAQQDGVVRRAVAMSADGDLLRRRSVVALSVACLVGTSLSNGPTRFEAEYSGRPAKTRLSQTLWVSYHPLVERSTCIVVNLTKQLLTGNAIIIVEFI